MKKISFAAALCSIVMAFSIQATAFSDVTLNAWYEKEVHFVAANGLMNGMTPERFEPEGLVSRGMLVTVLFRMDGASVGDVKSSFADVKIGSYYEDAVAWAENHRIVTGYSETRFGPNEVVTREQLATILYRYAGYKGYDVSKVQQLRGFLDSSKVSAYAKNSMEWAVGEKLMGGVSADRIEPQGSTTRAQLATIIARFSQKTSWREIDQNGTQDKSLDVNNKENNQKPENLGDSGDRAETTISVESVTTGVNDANVRVAVLIKNNPGVLGLSLKLFYDDSKMTLLSVHNGDALSRNLSMTAGKDLSSGCRIIWDGVEMSRSDVADGEILIMNFQIKNLNERGEFPIEILYETAVDNDLLPVSVKIINGQIVFR